MEVVVVTHLVAVEAPPPHVALFSPGPPPRPRCDHGPEFARDGLVGPALEGDDVGGDLGQVLFFRF